MPPDSLDNESLSSNLDTNAAAQEVQSLNPDVIDTIVRNDDFAGFENLQKTVTAAKQRDEEQGPLPSSARRRSTIVESIRRTSTFQKIEKFRWWDTEFKKERIKVYTGFLRNYLILSLILICVLCIYWGTYYNRPSRYSNLNILVVNDDQSVDGVVPVIGEVANMTSQSSTIAEYGGWKLFTHEEFLVKAQEHDNTIVEEILREVHHQNYWGAIYVKPNITYELIQAISTNDTSFNVTENLVEVYYETGRDFITMSTYVTRFLKVFETGFITAMKSALPDIIAQLSSDETKLASITFLSQPMSFSYIDMRPVDDPVLMAPLQLGLTYLVILAFFQVLMTIKIQIYISTFIKGPRFLILKFLWSQLSSIILALGFVIINVAFGLPYDATFGRSGALVLWGVGYLMMASLGALNEMMLMILFTLFPPLIGGWLVLLMVLNVAPTVSPMALTNHFYRYGYALPIHNGYELLKVVFCNTYKGQMGRNIGILLAWFAVFNILNPLFLVFAMKKKARKENDAKERGEEVKPMKI